MQPETPKTPSDKFIFYDFETDFSTGEHVVNFAVAQYADGTEFVFKRVRCFKWVLFVSIFNGIQNYLGPLPAIENYNPDMKSEKVRNDLITWHSK